MTDKITNGAYEPDDFGPIGDTARIIASYCDGEARANVYKRAKIELARHAAMARKEALEEAAKICEEQERSFLSPDYSTGQPLSSFAERLACKLAAQAIRQSIERGE